MPRLPVPGLDVGGWGDVLNDFLRQAHTEDGCLRPGSVSSAALQANSVTEAKLESSVRSKLSAMSLKADASDVVRVTGYQNIAGSKVFNDYLIFENGVGLNGTIVDSLGEPRAADHAATKGYVDGSLAAKADSSAVVQLSGPQTVAGDKQFAGATTLTGGLRLGSGGRHTGAVSLVAASAPVNYCDATAGAFTVILPAAAAAAGQILIIKKTDGSANVLTISRSGTDMIDGSSTYALTNQYGYVQLISDGTGNWFVIGGN